MVLHFFSTLSDSPALQLRRNQVTFVPGAHQVAFAPRHSLVELSPRVDLAEQLQLRGSKMMGRRMVLLHPMVHPTKNSPRRVHNRRGH